MSLQVTPSQTAGPFLHIGMLWPDGPTVVADTEPGAVWIGGRVIDGAGDPVADGLIETWQADAQGRFASAEDPRGTTTDFRGWGRCETDAQGGWRIRTVKPGPVPGPGGTVQAPHIDVTIHARGLLRQVLTRIYFADEAEANAADPVLAALPDAARRTLLAQPADGGYHHDVLLQGDDATVFFDY